MNSVEKQLHDELVKRLTDEGRLIEAGWRSLRMQVIAKDAPQVQLDEMRMAFFAGAQHVFGALGSLVSDTEEVTEQEIHRVGQIDVELTAWIAEMRRYMQKGMH